MEIIKKLLSYQIQSFKFFHPVTSIVNQNLFKWTSQMNWQFLIRMTSTNQNLQKLRHRKALYIYQHFRQTEGTPVKVARRNQNWQPS